MFTTPSSASCLEYDLGDVGDGDFFNVTSGSLTGNLVSGHTYSLFFFSSISSGLYDPPNTFDYQGFANSNFSASLTIDQAVVPVPAAVWMLGSALVLLGAVRRRAVQLR